MRPTKAPDVWQPMQEFRILSPAVPVLPVYDVSKYMIITTDDG